MKTFLFYTLLDIRYYKPESYTLVGEVSPATNDAYTKIRKEAERLGRKIESREKKFNTEEEAMQWMSEMNDECRFNLEEEREYEND